MLNKKNLLFATMALSLSTLLLAELPYNAKRRADIIDAKLQEADALLLKARFQQASIYIDQAEKEIGYLFEYYGDKFNHSEPQILRIQKHLAMLKGVASTQHNLPNSNASTTQGTSPSKIDNAVLKKLIPMLSEYRDTFNNAQHETNSAIRALSGVSESGDVAKINKAVMQMGESVSKTNTIAGPIEVIMSDLNQQYPDNAALMIQGQDGADTAALLRSLNDALENWKAIRSKQAKRWLREAKETLAQSDMLMQQAAMMPQQTQAMMLNPLVPSLQSSQAKTTALLSLIDSERMQSEYDDLQQRYEAVYTKVASLSKEVAAQLQAQITANRFPEDLIHNSDDEAQIQKAFQEKFGAIKIERMGIYSDWSERKEARWIDGTLTVGTYKYIGAWIVHKVTSGKYFAYKMSFRKTLNSDGSLSTLVHYGVGHSYEILEKNLDK